MKRIVTIALILALALPSLASAGPIRNLLGRGKSAAGKVLKRAAKPFGGCAGGKCG